MYLFSEQKAIEIKKKKKKVKKVVQEETVAVEEVKEEKVVQEKIVVEEVEPLVLEKRKAFESAYMLDVKEVEQPLTSTVTRTTETVQKFQVPKPSGSIAKAQLMHSDSLISSKEITHEVAQIFVEKLTPSLGTADQSITSITTQITAADALAVTNVDHREEPVVLLDQVVSSITASLEAQCVETDTIEVAEVFDEIKPSLSVAEVERTQINSLFSSEVPTQAFTKNYEGEAMPSLDKAHQSLETLSNQITSVEVLTVANVEKKPILVTESEQAETTTQASLIESECMQQGVSLDRVELATPASFELEQVNELLSDETVSSFYEDKPSVSVAEEQIMQNNELTASEIISQTSTGGVAANVIPKLECAFTAITTEESLLNIDETVAFGTVEKDTQEYCSDQANVGVIASLQQASVVGRPLTGIYSS